MSDDVIDGEVVGTDLEPVQHGTLFRTDEPAEIVRRSVELADTLAKVLRDKNLIVRIGQSEHVKVEGWTFCGTMLGVFPVTEWTRRTEHEDGWEARVEARTLSGAVVGAAEAECLRSEKQWSYTPTNKYGKELDPRDDYALRSMAQTRATSKALRQPLGFIVTLAGFESTPAEEMPAQPIQETRSEGPKPLVAPKSWAKLTDMVAAYDQQTHDVFFQFSDSVRRYLFPDSTDTKSLSKGDRDVLFQKCAGAAVNLREQFDPNEMPGPGVSDIRAAFAQVLDGLELAIPEEES